MLLKSDLESGHVRWLRATARWHSTRFQNTLLGKRAWVPVPVDGKLNTTKVWGLPHQKRQRNTLLLWKIARRTSCGQVGLQLADGSINWPIGSFKWLINSILIFKLCVGTSPKASTWYIVWYPSVFAGLWGLLLGASEYKLYCNKPVFFGCKLTCPSKETRISQFCKHSHHWSWG